MQGGQLTYVDNYFRVGAHTFGFDSDDLGSVKKAWARANELDGLVAIFRPIKLRGMWKGCAVVGLVKEEYEDAWKACYAASGN